MDTLLAFLKEWGGIILSLFVAVGSLWAYMRHDKQLKQQQSTLNDLLIKQYEKEEAKERMALMKAQIFTGQKGNAKIRFYNTGEADANNVRIEILSHMSGIYHDEWGPYEVINPQSYREERLWLCEGHSKTIDLRITWDDGIMQNRTASFNVPF